MGTTILQDDPNRQLEGLRRLELATTVGQTLPHKLVGQLTDKWSYDIGMAQVKGNLHLLRPALAYRMP